MNLRRRLSNLIAWRVVVSTLLLGSAILIEVRAPGTLPGSPYFLLIATTYALSIVYLASLRLVERYPGIADAQLGLDAVLVSAFIAVTGGVTSLFSSLYCLPIIAASRVRFRRGALQLATLTSLLYLGMVWAQYTGAYAGLPSSWTTALLAELPTIRFAEYTVAINLFGFVAVALLSGSLAEGLRSAGARLERASNHIADLREFNEHVIDSLLSGLATADERGVIRTFNRAASLITSLPAERAVGRPLGEVFQLSEEAEGELRALDHDKRFRSDVRYRTSDARTIDMGLTATTLAFPSGRIGYLVTFQDVTDVRRLERQARIQQRLAAVGEMAAGIAHEIRNPLASMSGSIQVLRQELSLTDEQAQLMDIVVRESDRLNQTIRSFLTYARPQRFAVTRLDLSAIVNDVALLLRNGSDVRDGHLVQTKTPPDPVWFEADDTQIRQILWNLATNGLRAMPDGGRLVLSVDIEATSDDHEQVVLLVADEGRGIPTDEVDSLFEPFHSSFEHGTGLGLAIVHRIVTEYGGAIHVASTVHRGTTFRVCLPLRGVARSSVMDKPQEVGLAS